MGLFSAAKLFAVTLRESATDGSDFTNPDADYRRLFLGEDGDLHLKDSSGTVTDIGGGSAAAAPLGLVRYAAGADAATYTIASATQADVDATNAIVTFTAPASGNVIVDVAACTGNNNGSAQNAFFGLRESTTNIVTAQLIGNFRDNILHVARRSFYLTGISGGSHTYKLAWSCSGGTQSIYTGPTYGNIEMTVWAAS